MSWIEEKRNRIFNENTIVKPWKTEQLIKLFEYLIENGVEEFTKFSSEAMNLSISEKNCLFMLEVYAYSGRGPIKEKWKEILERYPNIKKFLEDNDMLDKRMLCSELWWRDLFDWDLTKNPNLAKTFLTNMKKIECLHANVCWYPYKNNPFTHDGNGMFPCLSHAIYDVTDEDEKLIFIEKYYCGLDLKYYLLYSRFTEKNGRKYRHDIYSFEYENADEKAKQGYNIEQGAGHGWMLQVINNGKNIRKMMHLQDFRMTNVFDGKCHNLPSLEEVERLDLTDEMKTCKTDKELTKAYLKCLERDHLGND